MRQFIKFLFIFFFTANTLFAQDLDSSFGEGGITAFPFALTIPSQNSQSLYALGDSVTKKNTVLGIAHYQGNFAYFVSRMQQTDGKMDSSFGINGTFFIPSFALDASKSVIGFGYDSLDRFTIGFSYTIGSFRAGLGVLRLNKYGVIDSSFGVNGIATFQFGSNGVNIIGINVKKDGKIIACGEYNNGYNNDFLIAQVNQAGKIDSNFNEVGYYIGTFSSGAVNEIPVSFFVADDGKIVVAGRVFNTMNNDIGIMRLLPNGKIDSSFANHGKFIHDFGSDEYVFDCTPGKNGSIVVIGLITNISRNFLIKLLNNGSFDPSFGVNGKFVLNNIPVVYNTKIVALGNNKIIKSDINGLSVISNNGLVVTSRPNLITQAKRIVFADPNKVFVFSENSSNPNNRNMAVWKLDSNLLSATEHGSNGVIAYIMGETFYTQKQFNYFTHLNVQVDKKILYCGSTDTSATKGLFVARRLANSGLIDFSFGNNGIVLLGKGVANYLMPLPDTSMLVCGYLIEAGNKVAFVVKLNQNGSIDSSYGLFGFRKFYSFDPNNEFRSMTLYPNGSVLLVGSLLARFTANGDYDETFGNFGLNYNFSNANSCTLLPNNKLILFTQNKLIGLLADGSIDPNFTQIEDSRWVSCVGSRKVPHEFKRGTLRPDGKIYVTYNVNQTIGGCVNGNMGSSLLIDQTGKIDSNYYFRIYTGSISSYKDIPVNFMGYSLQGNKMISPFWEANTKYSISWFRGEKNVFPKQVFTHAKTKISHFDYYAPNSSSIVPYKLPSRSVFQSENKLLVAFFQNDTLILGRHVFEPEKFIGIGVSPRKIGALRDTFRLEAQTYPKASAVKWTFSETPTYLLGTDSSSQNPVVVFQSVYSNKSIAIGLSGLFEDQSILVAQDSLELKAEFKMVDFEYNKVLGSNKDTFEFKQTCSNNATRFEWTITPSTYTFVNGSGKDSGNIDIVFLKEGSYSLQLKAWFGLTADSLTRTNLIQIAEDKIVDFDYDKVIGSNKDTFEFKQTCSANATRFEWTITPSTFAFVNGSSKDSGNIDIVFLKEGSYSLQLKAWFGLTADSLIRTNLIQITEDKIVDFDYDKVIGSNKDTFNFNQTCSNNATRFEWTITPSTYAFVNGSSKDSGDISLIFNQVGIYSVQLKAWFGQQADSILRSNLITINSVGLAKRTRAEDFILFPNPSSKEVFIQPNFTRDNCTYQVISPTGQIAAEGTIDFQIKQASAIPLENLSNGMYYIKFTINENIYFKTLLVVN